jgi:tetratricopeptide (TPR) repeat protein
VTNRLCVAGRRFPEAGDSHREALRADPDHAEARLGLGGALIMLDRPAEALAQYDEVLRHHPDLQAAALQREAARAATRPALATQPTAQ